MHKDKGFAGILPLVIIVLLLGVVGYLFVNNYKIVKLNDKGEDAKVENDVQRIQGIDVKMDKVMRYRALGGENDWLVISFIFAANVDCPLEGGAVCGNGVLTFKLQDEDGFLMERLLMPPNIAKINPLKEMILRKGEKNSGDIVFLVPKEKDKFKLRYYTPSLSEEVTWTIENTPVVTPSPSPFATPRSTPLLMLPM